MESDGTLFVVDDVVLDEENFELMLDSQEFRRDGEADNIFEDSLEFVELLGIFSELP